MSFTDEIIKDVFNKQYKNLCYFAYTIVNDKIIAEDFVQEAFVVLCNNFYALHRDGESSIKSFLYSTVRNSILNWHRKNTVEKKYHDLKPYQDILTIDFDNALIKSEVIQEINKIILDLPVSCKTVFQMHYLEGLSLKEIAEKLQLSINTIKTQKSRGLKYVQSKLNPEYFLLFIIFF